MLEFLASRKEGRMPRRDLIINNDAVVFALKVRGGRARIREVTSDLWESLDPQTRERYGNLDRLYSRVSSILSENQGVVFTRVEKGVWELMGERLV